MTAGRTNHTRFASGTGSTQGVPLTNETIEAIVHYNVRSAAYAFVSSLIPRADRMDHSSPLWYGWALREAFIAGHHHALNHPIDHPTLDDLREWRKVIDDMIAEASPPNPFRERMTSEQSASNIEPLIALEAFRARGGKSLRDLDLQHKLLTHLNNLEVSCDAIGPTPLRHRLSELIVQMRAAIWAFDQATYESDNELVFEPKLTTFEVIGPGFKAATDATDDRIIWVNARSLDDVKAACIGLPVAGVLDLNNLMLHDIDFTLPADVHKFRQKIQSFM